MNVNIYQPTSEDGASAEELKLFDMLNAYRVSKGLAPLTLSKALTITAGRHAVDIVANTGEYIWAGNTAHNWSDTSVYADQGNAPARLGTGYMAYAGEVLAGYGAATPDGIGVNPQTANITVDIALNGWKNSPGHNAQLLDPNATIVGVGIYKGMASIYFGGVSDPSGLPSIDNFDPLRYIASNGDLIAAFGTDTAAATQHYIDHGAQEGRSTTGFDALRYLASNGDLAAAFGTDVAAAERHYIATGVREGRATASFDPVAYLAANSDVAAAYGATNTAAAETHYILYGRNEGRALALVTVVTPTGLLQVLPDGGNTLSLGSVNTLVGGGGYDVVTMAAAGNTLLTRGLEVLVGGAGNDVVVTGDTGTTMLLRGLEVLVGGAGTDVVTIGDTGTTMILRGLETLVGGAGTDVVTIGDTGTTMTVSGIETITGGAGGDVLTITGGTTRYVVTPGTDSIALAAANGADQIVFTNSTGGNAVGGGTTAVTQVARFQAGVDQVIISGELRTTAGSAVVAAPGTVSTLMDVGYASVRAALGNALGVGGKDIVVANDGRSTGIYYAADANRDGTIGVGEIRLLGIVDAVVGVSAITWG